MNFKTKYFEPSIGRFRCFCTLLDVFPSHSPYLYSFNNPISYSYPTGLAPEKEKGGGNKIQHMNWFELLKESWQQYNVEYQNSWMIEKILEKLNRDMFWNDQLNSLIAMANNADTGVDESADMARKARQGRLGNGVIKIDGNKGTTKYSIGGYSMTVYWTVEKVESEEELNNSVREAGRKVIESLDRIADAGEYGFSIMKDFVREMYKTKQTLHFDLTLSGYDLANLWNKSCGTNYEFILGVSSNSWLFYDVGNETCNVQGINKGSIYIAKEFLGDLSEIKKYSIYEYNTSFRYTFSMVFYHEFKHKYDSMFEFIPFDKEVSARRFVNCIFDFYIMRYRIIRF